jgi:hypothetical protein
MVGDFILFLFDKLAFGELFINFILVSLLLLILGLILLALMNLIINLLKYDAVLVNEKFIIHMNKRLDLDKIGYITLYLPQIESRTSGSIQELSVYINDEEHIVIRRPSIRLIIYLKKRCKNARFAIDDLKSRLKTDPIISACATVATIAIALFVLWKQQ